VAALEQFEEKSSGLLESLLKAFALSNPESLYAPREQPVYDKDLFALEGKIIKDIVGKENAVVMGRGGFFLLKDRPKSLHVFIYASKSCRAERLVKTGGAVDLREAQAKIEESDQRKTKFMKDMMGAEWTDARNYNLCIDTSVIDLSEGVSLVVRCAKAVLGLSLPSPVKRLSAMLRDCDRATS
jgi:CMP/dCMP kinase